MTRIYGLFALVILLTILALVFGGVMIVRAQISDPTDNTDTKIVEQGISLTDAIHHHLVAALDRAGEGSVGLSLDAYDVNELLYALAQEIGSDGFGIKSIYIEETDGSHRLCAPIRVIGVDSLISGELTLYSDDYGIFARIDGVSIGDIGIDSGIVNMLGVKRKILDVLSEIGINAHFEDDALEIQMSMEDIGGIISTALADNPNVGLVDAIYSLLVLRGGAVDIEIISPTDISLSVDMTLYGGLSSQDFDGVNEYTESLLSGGVIDKDSVGLVSKYYLNGYGKLTDEEKTELTTRLESVNTPDELSAYGGIVKREKISLVSLLLTQLEDNDDYLIPGFKIGDNDINAMLSDLPLVGTVWQYSSYRDNSCAFVAVQSVYLSISDDLIEFFIDLNVNGYILTVRSELVTGESPASAISGRVESACLGEVALDSYEMERLFDFLSEKLQYDWIYTDRESMTLTIDFTSAFEENSLLAVLLRNSKRIVTVCKSRAIAKGGYAQITFTLF